MVYSKLMITGTITVMTGMHIGGSDAFAAIGAVDSPVIKDARTKEPIIPGSSLKGKLRTLLARSLSQSLVLKDHKEDAPEIKRLFGASAPEIVPSRLLFYDCFLSKNTKEELQEIGTTEVKFENTINRATAMANPRQIERVIRGTRFLLKLVYELAYEKDTAEVKADFVNLAKGFELLQMDYLGGHGTRGYGRVKIGGLSVKPFDDQVDTQLLAELNEILKGVN